MNLIVRGNARAEGTFKVSGDKSISHRALLIGAIARGTTVIRGRSNGADCCSTINCLCQLGVEINVQDDNTVIQGKGIKALIEADNILDCGNSGTTIRLLAGVLCGQRPSKMAVLTGDDSLRRRPMIRVIDPLTRMNARIWSRNDGRAPLCIQGNNLRSINYTLPVASAQVKSALIFAAMQADDISVIEEPVPTRDHTERMLQKFGADLKRDGNRISISPINDDLIGQEISVPGDISSAAFFIVMASILPGSRITIQKTGVNPSRAGIIEVMQSMGAEILFDNRRELNNELAADLTVQYQSLQATEIKGKIIPRLIDELPVIAVAATQARGKTLVSNARELRVKEADRITAIVKGLTQMGAKIREKIDGFEIVGPSRLHGAVCRSFNDHRIAMALTIAGLIADGETIVEDSECIDISFPEFVSFIRRVCGDDAVRIQE